MKIGLQTWGSEGDIIPFIALAWALSRADHEVTLAITSTNRKDYTTTSKKCGFNLGTVDYVGSDEKHLANIVSRIQASSNLLTQVKLIFEEMFEPCVPSMFETAQSLCEQNEIIIGHFIHHPIQAASEKAGRPYITVTLNHGAIPTRHSPPTPYPDLGERINALAWKVSGKILNHALLPAINDLRKNVGLKLVGSYRDVWESRLCNLLAISPVLCQPRDDWADNQKVCGFFELDEHADNWKMPEHLTEFLNKEPAPVYMTLGSVIATQTNPTAISDTTRLFYDAAKFAGCRAVIQSKWEVTSGIPEDESICRVSSAPYAKVFPKCAAVVHHGGAGTTQTAAHCGCPSVVIAHIPDQILWGKELRRLGIGGRVLRRRSVTPQKLAREIKKILDDPSMRERATKIARQLEPEDGVSNAVTIIENLLKSRM